MKNKIMYLVLLFFVVVLSMNVLGVFSDVYHYYTNTSNVFTILAKDVDVYGNNFTVVRRSINDYSWYYINETTGLLSSVFSYNITINYNLYNYGVYTYVARQNSNRVIVERYNLSKGNRTYIFNTSRYYSLSDPTSSYYDYGSFFIGEYYYKIGTTGNNVSNSLMVWNITDGSLVYSTSNFTPDLSATACFELANGTPYNNSYINMVGFDYDDDYLYFVCLNNSGGEDKQTKHLVYIKEDYYLTGEFFDNVKLNENLIYNVTRSVNGSDNYLRSEWEFRKKFVVYNNNIYLINESDRDTIVSSVNNFFMVDVKIIPSAVEDGGDLTGGCKGFRSGNSNLDMGFAWFLNGSSFPVLTGVYLNLTGGVEHNISSLLNVSDGDSWIFSCILGDYDGFEVVGGTYVNSTNVTVGGNYFTNDVRIIPDTVVVGSNITGECNGSNISGGDVDFSFKWYLNDVEYFNGTSYGYPSNVWSDLSFINGLSAGDSWIFSCSTNDSFVWLNSSSVTVGSLNVSSVSIIPSTLFTNSVPVCNWTLQYANSGVSANVSWFLNGNLVTSNIFSGLTGTYAFGNSLVTGGVLECDVSAYVGNLTAFGSASGVVLNSLHTYGVVSRNVSVPKMFNSVVFSVNVSDVDNDVVSVFFNVSVPSGVVVLNGNFVSGNLWVSDVLLINESGNYSVSVVGDDGSVSASSSFAVSDVWSVNPLNFIGVVNVSENYSFNLELMSDSNENLSYNFSFVLPENFSGVVNSNPVFVVGDGNFSVVISMNASLSEGNYFGNLTVTRLNDNVSKVISLSLGVAGVFGQPFIVNKADWSVSIASSGSTSRNFVVNNTGDFTLSDCVPSIDGNFVGASFVSFSNSNFTVGVGQVNNFSVIYTHPSPAIYQGFLQVVCVSASGGQLNSLVSGNRPYLQLVSTSSSVVPPSGGGGNVVEVSSSNVSLFRVTTDTGSLSADLFMYPLQSRVEVFVVTSLIAGDQSLVVKCSGNMCPYVVLSKSNFILAGFSQEVVSATLSLPDGVKYGDVFTYDLVVSNGAGNSGFVRSQVVVSKVSNYLSKFAFVVDEGDNGYWFSLGNFNVPKIVLYLLLVIISELVAYALLPKDKASANLNTFVFVSVFFVVFIGASLIF